MRTVQRRLELMVIPLGQDLPEGMSIVHVLNVERFDKTVRAIVMTTEIVDEPDDAREGEK